MIHTTIATKLKYKTGDTITVNNFGPKVWRGSMGTIILVQNQSRVRSSMNQYLVLFGIGAGTKDELLVYEHELDLILSYVDPENPNR